MLAFIVLAALIEIGDGVVTDAPVEWIPDDVATLVVPVAPPLPTAGPAIDPTTAPAPQGQRSTP
jgi:hypothetical protein